MCDGVPIATPAIFLRVLVVVVLPAAVSSKFLQSMGPMTVRREMGFKRRRGRATWRVKCGKMTFWQGRSSLMDASCGTAVSDAKPLCGQEPIVEGAKPTFRQGCMESIRRPGRKLGAAGQHHHPQVMERIKCWCTKPSGQKNRVA